MLVEPIVRAPPVFSIRPALILDVILSTGKPVIKKITVRRKKVRA
jgi:hypothetical protein